MCTPRVGVQTTPGILRYLTPRGAANVYVTLALADALVMQWRSTAIIWCIP